MVSVTIRCRKDHLGPQSCHELVSLTTTTLPGNTSKIFRPSMAVGLWFWLCEYSTLLFGTPWVGLLERDEQGEHSATTVPAASSTNTTTFASRLCRRALRNATSPNPTALGTIRFPPNHGTRATASECSGCHNNNSCGVVTVVSLRYAQHVARWQSSHETYGPVHARVPIHHVSQQFGYELVNATLVVVTVVVHFWHRHHDLFSVLQ